MALYLFPAGKGTNILRPGGVESLTMLLAFVCDLLTDTISRFGSSVPMIHCAVLSAVVPSASGMPHCDTVCEYAFSSAAVEIYSI